MKRAASPAGWLGLRAAQLAAYERDHMRFIHLFLVGYFVLVVGVALALWQTGVLSHVAPVWIGIGALIAIGIGIMLSVSSGKPDLNEEIVKS
jgi:hypothetical protein